MTCRQFYIMIAVFVISLKIQKLPCFVSAALEKDGYLLILLYFIIEFALICLAMFIAKRTKDQSYEFSDSVVLRVLKNLLLIAVAFYFLMQGVLFYEAIQDLFSHILFENLPWTLFSILLIALVFYLANSGLKNISLSFELYAFIIFGSLLLITIFGAVRTDFSTVLPFQTINFGKIVSSATDFSFWFGDFFIVLLLAREAKEIKLKWTLLVYTISMLLLCLMYVEFYSIYVSYSSMQPSMISTLSEQSMLGVDIGRIDWFLILLSEIGTILCSGVCLYFAKKSLHSVIPKIGEGYILAALMLILYLLDILLLVDFRIKMIVYIDCLKYVALGIKVVVIIVGTILAVCSKKSNQTKSEKTSQNNSAQRFLKEEKSVNQIERKSKMPKLNSSRKKKVKA